MSDVRRVNFAAGFDTSGESEYCDVCHHEWASLDIETPEQADVHYAEHIRQARLRGAARARRRRTGAQPELPLLHLTSPTQPRKEST